MKKNLQWITSSTIWESPAFKQWKTLGTIASNIQPEHNVSLAIDFLEYYDECSFGIFENCSVSDLCIDHLWKDPDSGYLLTHQVLFHHILLQVKHNKFSRIISFEATYNFLYNRKIATLKKTKKFMNHKI